MPTAALPGAFTSGAGTINRMNGTGWYTLDANGVWRGWAIMNISFGAHRDAETFAQTRNNLTDWIAGGLGTVANAAKGRTATNALWAAGHLDHAARPQSWRWACAMRTGAPMPARIFRPRPR